MWSRGEGGQERGTEPSKDASKSFRGNSGVQVRKGSMARNGEWRGKPRKMSIHQGLTQVDGSETPALSAPGRYRGTSEMLQVRFQATAIKQI